jgi:hypothetical protein
MNFRKLFTLVLASVLLALPALAAQRDHPARPQFDLNRIPGRPAPKDVKLALTIEGCRSSLSLGGHALLIPSEGIHFLEDGTAVSDANDTAVTALASSDRDVLCHGRPGRTWYTVTLSAVGKTWPARKFKARSGKTLDLVKIALAK